MKLELRKEPVKEVRAKNMVPGVMYGKAIETQSIMIDERLLKKIYNEFGRSRTFQVQLEGKKHIVYIKDLQIDTYRGNKIMHFDFQKVSETDTMTVAIPVVAVNKEEVEKRKLFVQIVTDAIETEYAVGKGISSYDIDVAEFNAGDAIYIKDLVVPEGLTILEDPEKMVLIVKEPTVKLEEVTEPTEGEEETEETEETEEESTE